MNASSKAKQKYNAKAYDRVQLMIPKGMGDIWKEEASKRGMSLNAFVQNAVSLYLNNCANCAEKRG